MDGIMDEISTNEALQSDEIEALSAIFENDFVLEDISNRVYSITVKNSVKQSVYIQFTFPHTYPLSSPPTYLISAPWLNRDAKQRLSLELDEVYSQNLGTSIIFSWIERIKDFIEDTAKKFEIENLPTELVTQDINANVNADETKEDELISSCFNYAKVKDVCVSAPTESASYSPVIKHGETIIDRKSVFQAHVAKVSSEEEIKEVLRILKENRKIASATHNIMAYRINRGNILVHDFDDDGETKAGSGLLHLLEILDANDLVVVVSRWYGGIHLGPDRFKHINNAARSLLVREGLAKQRTTDTKKSRR